MKKFLAVFLAFSILVLSGNLYAKEKKGAQLAIQKKDGREVKGELISVKGKSLLLLDRESGVDIAIDISEIKVITIMKQSKFLKNAGLGILIFGGIGAMFGYAFSKNFWGASNVDAWKGAAQLGAVGAGFGFIMGVLSGEKGKDEIEQIEGRSRLEIMVILGELRSKARVPDYN